MVIVAKGLSDLALPDPFLVAGEREKERLLVAPHILPFLLLVPILCVTLSLFSTFISVFSHSSSPFCSYTPFSSYSSSPFI